MRSKLPAITLLFALFAGAWLIAPGAEPAGTIIVPFTQPDNHIHVPLHVDGHTYNFIFDTGGSASIMPDAARELHLPVVSHMTLRGAGAGAMRLSIVQAHESDLAGAPYEAGRFIVLGGPIVQQARSVDGIIGREFFKNYAITIDYAAQRLLLTPIANFQPPKATPVPLTLRAGQIPNVAALIDGKSGNFDVDTGGAGGLTLTESFVRAQGLDRDFPKQRALFLGVGAGGDVFGVIARGSSFTIGGASIPHPVVTIAKAEGVFAAPGLAGNIGPDALKRFTVTLDVPHNTAYFVPNAAIADDMPYNRSGLFTKRLKGRVIVDSVWEGSPAQTAGIAAGDEIVSVDGKDAASLYMAPVLARPAGTVIPIVFRHDGRLNNVQITLTDLL
jgi:hypothetical protein